MSTETPDPEAIYEAVDGFAARLEDGTEVNIREGSVWYGSDAVVIQFPQFFRPEPQDASRRRLAAKLQTQDVSTAHGEAQARQAESAPPLVGDTEEGNDDGYGRLRITREQILAAKRAHDAEGHNSESMHHRLGTTHRTLNRARHHYGLVPWPEGLTED